MRRLRDRPSAAGSEDPVVPITIAFALHAGVQVRQRAFGAGEVDQHVGARRRAAAIVRPIFTPAADLADAPGCRPRRALRRASPRRRPAHASMQRAPHAPARAGDRELHFGSAAAAGDDVAVEARELAVLEEHREPALLALAGLVLVRSRRSPSGRRGRCRSAAACRGRSAPAPCVMPCLSCATISCVMKLPCWIVDLVGRDARDRAARRSRRAEAQSSGEDGEAESVHGQITTAVSKAHSHEPSIHDTPSMSTAQTSRTSASRRRCRGARSSTCSSPARCATSPPRTSTRR